MMLDMASPGSLVRAYSTDAPVDPVRGYTMRSDVHDLPALSLRERLP